MKINFKFISLLVIICLLSISVASAAEDAQIDDLQANDADDVVSVDDAGTASTAKTLERKTNGVVIADDGDIIELDKDYELDKTIFIDNKITIDGKGHTIDGKNSVRAIAVRTTDVTLKNMIIKNGFLADKDSGAGVWAKEGGVTIINCTFINNKVTYGGAFYGTAGNNKIINCTFESNTATQSGGAININANGNTIINNTFKSNVATASNGGAIAITGQNTAGVNIIKGNTFESNKATKGDAGALYLDKTSGDEISDNVFTKNSADIGGALSLYEAGYSTITDNTFTDNTALGTTAKSLGGAARINIKTSTKKTTISGNTFKNNKAPNSGALHIDGSNVEISKNVFDNNKATSGYGGSIQFNGNTLKILNNNITNSNAKTYGGAMIVKTGKNMTIQSNNIENANAANGGAIFVQSGSATIDSNNFTKCTATEKGGAIRADTTVTITKNTFTDNSAKDKGSDVYIYKGANSQVTDNDFATSTANSLKNDDGSIVAKNNKGLKETVTLSTLNKNYAATTTTKYLTVVLKDATGAGIAGKNITITLNGKNYNGVTNANGQFKTKIALTTAKTYPCVVKFAGDEQYYAPTPYKFNIAVNKVATKISSPAKTFKKSATKKVVITLKAGSTVLKKQTVKITINKKTYKGTTNSKGKVTIKIKLTKKGTFKGTLKFAGTAKYKACTGKVTIKVK